MVNDVIYKCYFEIKRLNQIFRSNFQKRSKQKKKYNNKRKLQIKTKQNEYLLQNKN